MVRTIVRSAAIAAAATACAIVTGCAAMGTYSPAATPAPVRPITATATVTVTVGDAVATATATATAAPTVPACEEEDGSTPGQAFPCRWDAAHQGNGQGRSFTLVAPGIEAHES